MQYTDDQLSLSTAYDEASPKPEHEATGSENSGRQRQLHRILPETPSDNSAGYDNTSHVREGLKGFSPYEEISDVISQTKEQIDLKKGPTPEQEAKDKCIEGLYAKVVKVRKPRSSSIGPCSTSTGRNSPWSSGQRTLSRRSSFSNSESTTCGRRQFVSRHNGFWSSGSLQSVMSNQMCRLEHVEVNLTADSQGFGLTIGESRMGRNTFLVIAEIECGGPTERWVVEEN